MVHWSCAGFWLSAGPSSVVQFLDFLFGDGSFVNKTHYCFLTKASRTLFAYVRAGPPMIGNCLQSGGEWLKNQSIVAWIYITEVVLQ